MTCKFCGKRMVTGVCIPCYELKQTVIETVDTMIKQSKPASPRTAQIILIAGKAGSGKDTFANCLKQYLQQEENKKVLIIHFADYIKFICKEYFGWNGEKDEYGRTLLQQTGTENGRHRNDNMWCKIIIEFLKAFGQDYDYILIPDTRFTDEIELTKQYFDTISIYINRDKTNSLTSEQLSHESENLEPSCCDCTVNNNVPLEESFLDNETMFDLFKLLKQGFKNKI
jgi:energy-coupling factor transporter ATP-binding protein EcfA2